jgi:hypothetical protein
MRSTYTRTLARLMAALFVLTGIAGCKFDPGELSPPGGNPSDGGSPPDSRTPVDSRPTVDSMTPIDGQLPPRIDAMVSNQRRKQITIQASQVEAPASPGFLADFPVLFSVVDPQIAERASMDGSDIYFVAADGEFRLDYEIERWNPATGELVAWVKLPQVSASANTVFYVHYGDPEQAEPVNPTDVWTSDFVAVWHLAQDPGPGMPGDIVDSTTGNDGTARATMDTSDLVTGQIGNGLDFDGIDDEIVFENPISGNTSHTISAWVNQRTTNSDDAVVVLGTGSPNQARWFYSARTGNAVAFGFFANDRISTNNIENDGWTLLHWTYDGDTSNLYVNGDLEDGPVDTNPGVNTQGNAGRIGNVTSPDFGSAMNLNGRADEVRIATSARSPEWIRTEFNNQSNPSSFYVVGAESQ